MSLVTFGPGNSTRYICTSPRPCSSSPATSLSGCNAGTSSRNRLTAVSIRDLVSVEARPPSLLADRERDRHRLARQLVGTGGRLQLVVPSRQPMSVEACAVASGDILVLEAPHPPVARA